MVSLETSIKKIVCNMFSKIKKGVVKQALIYTITDGLSKAMSFLLLPLISVYLLPEQLGIAANFDVLQNILMLIAGQAIVNSIPYFYYERNRTQVAVLISSLLFLIIIANIIFAFVIFFTFPIIENYLQLGLVLQLLTTVSVVAHLLTSIDVVLFRLEEKPYAFSILQISQTSIMIILLFIFVVYLRLEAIGKIMSTVCAFSVMALVHIVLLIRRGYITLKISLAEVKRLLKFGIPLLPHSLSFWFKSGVDKIVVTSFCGLAVNGLYSMALSFAAIYSIFFRAFQNAYVPYLQKRLNKMTTLNEKTEKRNIVILTYKIFSGALVLYIAVVLVCWIAINYFLSEKYIDSFQFIPWLLLGLTIQTMYNLVVEFPYSVKKTTGLGLFTFWGSLIQMGLTYVLVREIGVNGVNYSAVVGAIVTTLGVWWYSNHVYPMPWFSLKANKL